MLIDFLAQWGKYAPHLLLFWAVIAYMVAWVRTRHGLFLKESLGLLGLAIGWIARGVYRDTLDLAASIFWWIEYAIYVLHIPLVIFPPFRGRRQSKENTQEKPWNGYAHLLDLLLFRRPVSKEAFESDIYRQQISASEPLSAGAALFVVAIALGVVGVIGVELRPCGQLDIEIGRSGCFVALNIDRGFVEALAFSPDGEKLAVSKWETEVDVYRVSDGALQQTFTGHVDSIMDITFSPNGDFLAGVDLFDVLYLWETRTAKLLFTLPKSNYQRQIAFSPGSDRLIVGNRESVEVYRLPAGELMKSFPIGSSLLALSPDGSLAAIGAADGAVIIRNLISGEDLYALQEQYESIRSMTFSPDGSILAGRTGDKIWFWQAPSGRLLITLPIDLSPEVAFSSDSTLLISIDDRPHKERRARISVWRIADGEQVTTTQLVETREIAVSSRGDVVAAGSYDRQVSLWRLPLLSIEPDAAP